MAHQYQGSELELFARAIHWKEYLRTLLAPYLKGEVLEVGAGIGSTTAVFCDGHQRRWVCLEPDPTLVKSIAVRVAQRQLPGICDPTAGTVTDLAEWERFDAILYIDVLEHIQDDDAEVQSAVQHLKKTGALIVVAPAHRWLFSPFDAAIGHHRRYTKKDLRKLMPKELQPVMLKYLDSVGIMLSAANRTLLRKKMPSVRDIAVWDRWVVPVSRVLDPLLGFTVGKSVVGVWRFK